MPLAALQTLRRVDSQREKGDGIVRATKRLAALKQERESWVTHWRELAQYILPRRARFLSTDGNNGGKKNDKIINGSATRAVRILAAGMQAGITSPARPWFRLATPDVALGESGPVKEWLSAVESRLRSIFARSNIYNALHNVYTDLATFGTSPLHIDEDAEDVLRAYVYPAGQYALANSARLRIDTGYRELRFTVAQLVEMFGESACSQRVRDQYRRGNLDIWIDVVYLLEPNRDEGHFGQYANARGKPFRSCWYEAAGHEGKYLREGGYYESPLIAPRWNVTGEDVYGHGPGMDALGDCKALQLLESDKGGLVAKIVNPPMQGPPYLANKRTSLLPGAMNYVPGTNGQVISPLYAVPPAAVQVAEESIQKTQGRIDAAFYADLWLMLSESERRDVTAREVAERHEEKMLQLGPVLERLEDELLDPLIDRAFGIALRANAIPPPPEELQGVELRVEYISIMAQAQKLLGTAGVERFAGFVGNLVASKPEVLDLVNVDEVVRQYADMLGLNPKLLNAPDVVAGIRAQRQEAQAQAQRAQATVTAVQGAKTLSEADMGHDSALTRLMASVGGGARA